MSLKIIFAGTPEFAKIQLEALIKEKYTIVAVYTQPTRPTGRGLKLQESPVAQFAREQDLSIEQPLNFKLVETQEKFRAYQADLLIVSAYGLILPKVILDLPRYGCWNVHGSLLPRWRGAAPIQRAILAGDPETGITLMQMNEGMDTGDILKKASIPILANDTSAALYDKLAHLGASVLLDGLSAFISHNYALEAIRQDPKQATLAPKIYKEEALIDWHKNSEIIIRKILAFNPWPIAHTYLDSLCIKIWQATIISTHDTPITAPPGTLLKANYRGLEVATADGSLLITELQLPNKKRMPVSEVLHSKKDLFTEGLCFHSTQAIS